MSTFSQVDSDIQLPAAVVPFIRYVNVEADRSARSVGLIRIWLHIFRLSRAFIKPRDETSLAKSAKVG